MYNAFMNSGMHFSLVKKERKEPPKLKSCYTHHVWLRWLYISNTNIYKIILIWYSNRSLQCSPIHVSRRSNEQYHKHFHKSTFLFHWAGHGQGPGSCRLAELWWWWSAPCGNHPGEFLIYFRIKLDIYHLQWCNRRRPDGSFLNKHGVHGSILANLLL